MKTIQVARKSIKGENKLVFPYYQKFYSFSTACMSLVDESARLHRLLCHKHYCLPVDDPSGADFIVISTCAVSKDAALNSINNIKKLGLTYGRKIFVIGCLYNAPERELLEQNVLLDLKFVHADEIKNEIDNFTESFNIKCVNRCKPFWLNDLEIKNKKLNQKYEKSFEKADKYGFKTDGLIFSTWPSFFQTIRLSKGCNKKCSYCSIPNNRGQYSENSFENIIKQIDNSVSEELLLIGENVGQHSNFKEIVEYICSKNKRVMIRYLEPEHTAKLKDIKFTKKRHHIGIPIQSGSKKVLRKMNRYHNIKYIKNTFKKLKKQGMYTGTSIILSHPTENWIDYLKTVWFIISTPLDYISFQNFSPREGTPDWKYSKWDSDSFKNRLKYKIFDILIKMKNLL